jgi:DNA-binding response OmpR family regulator
MTDKRLDSAETLSAGNSRLIVLEALFAIVFDGVEIRFSGRLFKLMHLMAQAAGRRVVSVAEIEGRLWKSRAPRNGVADAIRDLREKLSKHGSEGETLSKLIETRYLRGYVLSLAPDCVEFHNERAVGSLPEITFSTLIETFPRPSCPSCSEFL